MSDSWLPTNTLRLAQLAHPGREWTQQSDYWATARTERDLSGDAYIGFNADSLDVLAKVEQRVVDCGFGLEYARCVGMAVLRDNPDALTDRLRRNMCEIRATPDQRRRALIEVMDAHPEIEKQ